MNTYNAGTASIIEVRRLFKGRVASSSASSIVPNRVWSVQHRRWLTVNGKGWGPNKWQLVSYQLLECKIHITNCLENRFWNSRLFHLNDLDISVFLILTWMFYDQFSIDYYRSNLLGNEHVNAYSITCSYRILQYLCNFFLRKEHRTRMQYVTRNGIFEILRFEDIIHIANLLFSLKMNTWSGVIKITKPKFPENFWKTLQNFIFLHLIGILYYSFKLMLD